MGTLATLDLGAQDYTDLGFWKPVLATQLVPQGINVSDSDSMAIGGLVALNDVRSAVNAYVDTATVDAGSLTVRALELALIRATADSSVTSVRRQLVQRDRRRLDGDQRRDRNQHDPVERRGLRARQRRARRTRPRRRPAT